MMNESQINSFSVLFWGQKTRKNKLGEIPIYMRITVDGKRAELSTNRFIEESSWNAKAQRVKDRKKNAIQINGYLDMLRGKVLEIFNKLLASEEEISAKKIKAVLSGKSVKTQINHKTILEAFNYHNTKMEEQVKIGQVVKKTLERYNITKNKVRAFMKHQYKAKDMPLPELRLRFVTEFEHYLLTRGKLQINTAHKYIKNLKKIMNMAVGLDWIPSNPFNNFRCSYVAPKREVLTQDELHMLRSKNISIPRIDQVRDVFVFCCYTGFAYSEHKIKYHVSYKFRSH